MKTRNRISVWLALLAIMLAPACAQAQLFFSVNPDGTTVTLTGAFNPPPDLVIPSTYEGRTVTRIGDGALQFGFSIIGAVVLFTVSIPDTVTEIGQDAFLDQVPLRLVSFGSGVTTIGARAFKGCTILGYQDTIELPNSVVSIGSEAFAGCAGLQYMDLGTGLSSIGDAAFHSCPSVASFSFRGNAPNLLGPNVFDNSPSTLVFYDSSKSGWGGPTFGGLTAYPFGGANFGYPFTVNLINNEIIVRGWRGSVSNHTLVIPDTIEGYPVVAIGDSAFYNTSPGNPATFWFTNLTLPSGLRSVGSLAFTANTLSTPITIPAGATNVGNGLPVSPAVFFLGNAPSGALSALSQVYYKPGTTGWGPVFGAASTARGAEAGPFAYASTNGTVSLLGYFGFTETLVIPDSINGLPVTTIQSGAFQTKAVFDDANLKALKTVVVGNNITSLPDLCFYGGINLTNVVIPNGLTNIGFGALACPLLKRLYFRGTNVPYNPPENTYSGVTVYYPIGGNATSWGAAFPGAALQPWDPDSGMVVQLAGGNLTITSYEGSGQPLNIPATLGGYPVTSIGANAFAYSKITSITIPASVTSISDGAVLFATSLDTLWFKGNAPALSAFALYNTPATVYYDPGTSGWGAIGDPFGGRPTALWSTQVPSLLTLTNGTLTVSHYLGSGGAVTIPPALGAYPVTRIGQSAFESASITSLTLPGSLTHIENFAFQFCAALQSVTGGNGLISVGQAAFGYSGLTSITLPATFTTLSPFAFAYSAQLGKIFFNGNAPNQLANAFQGAPVTIYYDPSTVGWNSLGANFAGQPTGLWSAQIPSHLTYANGTLGVSQYLGSGGAMNIPSAIGGYPVTSIRTNAFVFSAINSLTIPDSVQSIGDYAFYGSSSLTSAIIGNGVTNIGQYTFAYCSALNSISVGNSVKTIGSSAFTSCAALTSITLPASLTSLGDLAFYNCGSLQSVFFKGNAPALGGGFVFDSTPATVYYLAGRTNWGPTLAGHTAVLWNPLIQASGPGLGVQGNQFRFMITGGADMPIAIEATTNLANPVWQRLQTGTLTNGSIQFNDSAYLANLKRFYRISSP